MTQTMDGRRAIRDARFLSHVECVAARVVEPLGLRADRKIGLSVGYETFQPALSIMPMEPAEPDAAWHVDFVGVVEVVWDRGEQEAARRQARAYACAPHLWRLGRHAHR